MTNAVESGTQRRPRRWRRVLSIAAAFLAIVLVVYVYGRATAGGRQINVVQTQSVTAPIGSEVLSVVAYNIAHGRGLADTNWAGDRMPRLREIAALLRELDADVVVLNEVDFDATWSGRVNQAAVIADLAGYPHRVEQVNYDVNGPFFYMRFGNAVLSRYPIVDAEALRYPDYKRHHTLAAGRKDGLVCTLHSPIGTVRVVAVHLEVRDNDVRLGSSKVIAQRVADTAVPTVVAGDFNAIFGKPDSAMDWFAEHTPLRGGDVVGGSFPSTNPNRLIDHILVSPDLTILRSEVIDSQLSDHRPVRAILHKPPADQR